MEKDEEEMRNKGGIGEEAKAFWSVYKYALGAFRVFQCEVDVSEDMGGEVTAQVTHTFYHADWPQLFTGVGQACISVFCSRNVSKVRSGVCYCCSFSVKIILVSLSLSLLLLLLLFFESG
ncbi:hypothetical protein E2C01_076975 [Portunus trituberculatus]|uniref:Uncharacterized protein n=1 Tax=Portunus trituberculatus TaxID=210409 RepID=A0A5B7IL18_PORTR|nr:hypothetical protein [Portunus trituberculatus]